MGIQRFGLRMRDYATKTTLGTITKSSSAGQQQQAPVRRNIAIIDGPGLAHYIYYNLCDSSSSSSTTATTTSAITYDSCAKATIAWLDKLVGYGFKIDSIFFDGALPATKKDVRIDRLQNYIARLQAFKQSSGTSLSSLSGSAKKSLPPPPFLVFAVVEELIRSTQYADLTYVVPGEADPYCVAAAQAIPEDDDSKITIFSDDADLIVYEACKRTRVVPFRDLSETEVGGTTVLQGDEYRPADIIERRKSLFGSSLIKPAFFMSIDYYCSLEKASRLSTGADLDDRDEFKAFARQFETAEEVQMLARVRQDPDLKKALTARDSRISELFHQMKSHARGETTGPIRAYLPFVMDDPTRATAWGVGLDIRLLGYSILLQSQQDTNVQEYRRSGARMSATLLDVLTGDELAPATSRLATGVSSTLEETAIEHRLGRDDAWRYLILQHVVFHFRSEGVPMPTADDAVHIVLNREPRKWQVLHLAAQYQAAYYSFRMLQQLLADVETSDGAQATLRRHLQSLPRIAVFFNDGEGSDRRHEQQVWREALRLLFSSVVEEEHGDQGDRKQAKSRKRAKKAHQKQADGAGLAKNPFAMLVD
ncbi:hypothetical protein CKM354_000093900 [Cercospora kikuchii]|uniref:Asteroid domain-containing protein n=1 Tax=Cercospora kikuchii TaxID=84275 RepID=A0A9P3C4U5_9PEZI|nr:uncharacterized protein CKM354_000093900 [Cercospora kikuchii]GIZ37494.1 hypothetical protein CKM354_000093900 [Cercospora kikuchii]